MESGLCDAIMLPVGPIGDRRFTAEILPRARALGVGTIGMKVFAGGKLLGDTEGDQRAALRARATAAARGKGKVWWDPTGAVEGP